MPPLPDVRQEYRYTCGVALAESVTRHFRKRMPAVRCSTRNGTSFPALAAAFRAAGLRVQYGQMDGADLRYHLSRGRVVCCVVPAPGGEGHWVGVWSASRGKVQYHDPDAGPCKSPLDAFLVSWRRRGAWGLAVGRE